jgi:hypothetical protein
MSVKNKWKLWFNKNDQVSKNCIKYLPLTPNLHKFWEILTLLLTVLVIYLYRRLSGQI